MRCKFSADSGILKVRESVRFGRTAAVIRLPKELTRSWSTFQPRSFSTNTKRKKLYENKHEVLDLRAGHQPDHHTHHLLHVQRMIQSAEPYRCRHHRLWHLLVLRCPGYSYRRSCPSGLQEKEGQGRQEEKEALSLKAVRNYR